MAQDKPIKYGLFGNLKAAPGKGDELAAILLEAAQLMATAQGCQLYLVGQDTQDDTVVWISEVWDTQQDHDNSLSVTGVKELIGQARPLLAGKPESGVTLRVLGGKGLD